MAARLAKLLFLAIVAIALAVVAVVLAASAAAARTTRHPQPEALIDAASGTTVSPSATAWLIIALIAFTAFLAGAGRLAVRRRAPAPVLVKEERAACVRRAAP